MYKPHKYVYLLHYIHNKGGGSCDVHRKTKINHENDINDLSTLVTQTVPEVDQVAIANYQLIRKIPWYERLQQFIKYYLDKL